MKKIIIVVVVIVVIIFAYFLIKGSSQNVAVNQNQATTTGATGSQATSTQNQVLTNGAASVIGKSVEGRDILAYHYGTGDKELLFVGGIHGGYEWNTALVAYQMMNYLKANSSVIPSSVKVTVVPVLNPDGLNKVVGTTTGNFSLSDVPSSQSAVVAGRFNANDVDLNRNFDCDWQSTGKWQSKTVSGGSAAFSEPESQAIENYVNANKLAAVVVWYSAAGGVYSSSCHNGVSSETKALTSAFATGSGYPAHESFDFYATTGDMVNWLAKMNIPAISVLLTNHTDTELSKNKAGVKALLDYYLGLEGKTPDAI